MKIEVSFICDNYRDLFLPSRIVRYEINPKIGVWCWKYMHQNFWGSVVIKVFD